MFQLIDFIIVNPIVNILFVIYNLVGDFGVAIIIFTCIVKILMWPLLKRQLHQTKLMRKIQPELTEIRKRCNGNKQMESLQTMDLYKRHNIKPMSSIWTLLIQLPIFFALFLAIRTIATPTADVNVASRAYPVTAEMTRIRDIREKQEVYLADTENNHYDFEPRLFGVVDLSSRAGLELGSPLILMAFAVLAAFMQYMVSRIQMPKKKSKTSWRKLVNDAKEGKDPDQNELNNFVSGQMSFMMPLMMFFIVVQLQGALVLYYLVTNTLSVVQYKIAFNKIDKEMDDNTDRAITRELKRKTKQIQEAEVVVNKKTGTKITRISARDTKNKNSKSKKSQSEKG